MKRSTHRWPSRFGSPAARGRSTISVRSVSPGVSRPFGLSRRFHSMDTTTGISATPRGPIPIGSRVVCTLDPDDPHSPGLLEQHVKEFGVKTLRSTAGNQRRTFDHDGVRQLWKTCERLGATVDIFLMHPDLVPSAEKLLREFPKLTVAFCHCMGHQTGTALRAVAGGGAATFEVQEPLRQGRFYQHRNGR